MRNGNGDNLCENNLISQIAISALLETSLHPLSLPQQLEVCLQIILSVSWLSIPYKGAIFLTDDRNGDLLMTVQCNMPEPLLKKCRRVPNNHCMCGKAAASRQVVFASHVDERHDISFENMPPHGHYCVPLLSEDKLLGVLNLYVADGHQQTPEEDALLSNVAVILSGIIEKRKMEKRLKEQSDHLQELIGRSLDMIISVDNNKNIFDFNPSASAALGYSSEEVISQPFSILFVKPNQADLVDVLTSCGKFSGEVLLKHKQGKAIPVMLSASPLQEGGLVVNGQDVSLKKKINEMLREKEVSNRKAIEEQLHIASKVFDSAISEVEGHLLTTAKVLENVVESVVIADGVGIIRSINPAFTRITGCQPEQVIGLPMQSLTSDRHEADYYQEMWQNLEERGHWKGETWLRCENCDPYPAWLSVTAVAGVHGGVSHYVFISQDLTKSRQNEEELRSKTYFDALTGLPNRLLFTDRIEQIIAYANRRSESFAVVVFDMDNFKQTNNSMGFAKGDQTLQEIARRISDVIRAEDSACRIEGDTFAFIFREAADSGDVITVIDRLADALAKIHLVGHQELFITASFGISMFPSDGDNANQLISHANLAMHRAKADGGNTSRFFDALMAMEASSRISMINDLREAIKNGELLVYFQPKVDTTDLRIVGMEALVRWKKGDRLIPPNAFIPLAEETGLIIPLGEWVLRTAVHHLRMWIDAGFPPLNLSVNLSARQFQQANLLEMIQGTLTDNNISPQFLELEITESMMMADPTSSRALIKSLRNMGVKISVDDFGTGYSSFSQLTAISLNTLKIDKSFLDNMAAETNNAVIIAAIISMARKMNLNVVAEGVETLEQLDFLRDNGCETIQGFYFSKPVPAADFTRLLLKDQEGKPST